MEAGGDNLLSLLEEGNPDNVIGEENNNNKRGVIVVALGRVAT